MIFHDVIQASPEWHELRRGIPTSSCFDRIIQPTRRKLSTAADDYIAELLGEMFSLYGPERPESYLNNAMRHGIETENEARRYLAMERGIEITNGGFCLDDSGRFGASPDGLIADEGVAEIKCPTAKVQAKYLLEGGLPGEYRCQVAGQLVVTGRKYVLFLSYHPGLPAHLIRVEPDDFCDDLRVCLELFHMKYQAALTKIHGL